MYPPFKAGPLGSWLSNTNRLMRPVEDSKTQVTCTGSNRCLKKHVADFPRRFPLFSSLELGPQQQKNARGKQWDPIKGKNKETSHFSARLSGFALDAPRGCAAKPGPLISRLLKSFFTFGGSRLSALIVDWLSIASIGGREQSGQPAVSLPKRGFGNKVLNNCTCFINHFSGR